MAESRFHSLLSGLQASWLVLAGSGLAAAPGEDHPPIRELRAPADCPWVDLSRHLERFSILDQPLFLAPRSTIVLEGQDRFIALYRDDVLESPTAGDWVAWVFKPGDRTGIPARSFVVRLVDLPVGAPLDLRAALSWEGDVILFQLDGVPAGGAVEVRASLADLEALVPRRDPAIPLIDLADDSARQVTVDREDGQYLGHPTTCLLEDGRTILCAYPKGHGRGAIVLKRSQDGGCTWSERLKVPGSFATSQEVPTLHRVTDPLTGKTRILLWSGLFPARLAFSEDDGATWSELAPVGDWGGIVVMGSVEALADGRLLAMFHDDGRFFAKDGRRAGPPVFTLFETFSADGGLSWSFPEAVLQDSAVQLCEPGVVRSPDGGTLAVLLRENRRVRNSFVLFSSDEGASWSPPRELPADLTGDRHTAKYAPDGRLLVSFRDMAHQSPTRGDWLAWVGTFDDLLRGTKGQYRVRLADNLDAWDCGYPGVEILPDGTFVLTTYGHWEEGQAPFIRSVRLTLRELDALAAARSHDGKESDLSKEKDGG